MKERIDVAALSWAELRKHQAKTGLPMPADAAPMDKWGQWFVAAIFLIFARELHPDIDRAKLAAAAECRRHSLAKTFEPYVLRALGDDIAANLIPADKESITQAERLDAVLQTTEAGDRYA